MRTLDSQAELSNLSMSRGFGRSRALGSKFRSRTPTERYLSAGKVNTGAPPKPNSPNLISHQRHLRTFSIFSTFGEVPCLPTDELLLLVATATTRTRALPLATPHRPSAGDGFRLLWQLAPEANRLLQRLQTNPLPPPSTQGDLWDLGTLTWFNGFGRGMRLATSSIVTSEACCFTCKSLVTWLTKNELFMSLVSACLHVLLNMYSCLSDT